MYFPVFELHRWGKRFAVQPQTMDVGRGAPHIFYQQKQPRRRRFEPLSGLLFICPQLSDYGRTRISVETLCKPSAEIWRQAVPASVDARRIASAVPLNSVTLPDV